MFDEDLKSCMKCRFFWGTDSRCIKSKCYKERRKPKKIEPIEDNICIDCPYKQSSAYCFPCMKKLMEKKQNEKRSGNTEIKEDDEDGR